MEEEILDNKPVKNDLVTKSYETFDEMVDFIPLNLLKGIHNYGFRTPAPIQCLTIEDMTKKHDLIVQSQSGSGKTGAFTIGGLSLVDNKLNYPQVLIISNARELSTQIYEIVCELSKFMEIRVKLCIGMKSPDDTDAKTIPRMVHEKNNREISMAHVLVGTPGKFSDLIERKVFNPKKVKLLILDEVDALLKFGFIEQIKHIFISLDENTQVCMFSASYNDRVVEFGKMQLRNPKVYMLEKDEVSLEKIKQYFIDIELEKYKFGTLIDLYKNLQISQCIIFVNKKEQVERLSYEMNKEGYTVSSIHGSMSSQMRNETLKNFRKGLSRVLITTDLLARGIDIEQIGIVINYYLPAENEQYLHRIGRSGRFGKIGIAINLITSNDYTRMSELETEYVTRIEPFPDFDYINGLLRGC